MIPEPSKTEEEIGMAASREWTEYHLTPRGWEAGTTSIDGARTVRPTPVDRFKSCTYKEEQGSVYSSVHKSVITNWTANNSAEVVHLESQFGDCPTEVVF